MNVIISEWGLAGLQSLAGRASVFVIVDVLSFSTAVSVAVDRGASIVPFPLGDRDAAAAKKSGAELALPRKIGGPFSLSPVSLNGLAPGTKLLLPSPNGSRLSLACGDASVLAGSLRNARATARKARALAAGGPIAVIAAGERWPGDGGLRPAIEDMLGAGAIIAALDGENSAEAKIMQQAYVSAGDDLGALISASVSGQELIGQGFGADVDFALDQECSTNAAHLVAGAYIGA